MVEIKAKEYPNTKVDVIESGYGVGWKMTTLFQRGFFKIEFIESRYEFPKLVIYKSDGLIVELEHEYDKDFRPDGLNAEEMFEKLTGGYSVADIQKFVYRRDHPKHCRKCGSNHYEWIQGFPGECYKICSSCESVLEYDFNISEII